MWPQWIGIFNYGQNNVASLMMGRINCVPGFGGRFWMFAFSNDCALSMHPRCAHFLMGDGTVVSLPDNIDISVYHALIQRDDGQSISLDF